MMKPIFSVPFKDREWKKSKTEIVQTLKPLVQKALSKIVYSSQHTALTQNWNDSINSLTKIFN